jgi:hypothetical protein
LQRLVAELCPHLISFTFHLFLTFLLLKDGLQHSSSVAILFVFEVKLIRGLDSSVVKALLITSSLSFLDLVNNVVKGVDIAHSFFTQLAKILISKLAVSVLVQSLEKLLYLLLRQFDLELVQAEGKVRW